jgi:hypothetical protein
MRYKHCHLAYYHHTLSVALLAWLLVSFAAHTDGTVDSRSVMCWLSYELSLAEPQSQSIPLVKLSSARAGSQRRQITIVVNHPLIIDVGHLVC